MPETTCYRLSGTPGEKLSSMAYNSLRDMIAYGQFAPGQRLYPTEIADRFGVSPTPIKEAFTRLATEKYLEATPRRGYTVTQPTPKRIAELWQVRCGLEVTAGELAIEQLNTGSLTDSALLVLDDRLEQIERDGGADHRTHVELNAAFHLTLVELPVNQALTSLYVGIAQHVIGAWVQNGLSTWQDRLDAERFEHRGILATLRGRDCEAFRTAMRQHLDRSLHDALNDASGRQIDAKGGFSDEPFRLSTDTTPRGPVEHPPVNQGRSI